MGTTAGMAETARPRDGAYPYTRWNFIVVVIDAGFFMASLAFIDPVAVLPVLLAELNASKLLIGLMGAIQRAGWLVPQLLVTSFVLHRARRLPFVIYPVLASRLPLIALAVVFTLTWGRAHPGALLFLTIGIFALFFFGDGMVGVPWHDILARTIPPMLRGRFFGSIQLLSGLLGILAGELVVRVLADTSLAFPFNYGRLFVFLCVGMAISTLFVCLIREPRGVPTAEARSLPRIVLAIPSTLRKYPLLRRLIVGQVLCSIPLVAMPFYAVYATEALGMEPAVCGRFVQAAIVGSAAASMIWAYLSDRHGTTRVLRTVSWVILSVPACALAVPPVMRMLGAEGAMPYAYTAVFLLNGATWGGTWIGFTNYVLEIAPDDIRPLFLGLQATLASPAVAMPFIGGWLLAVIPYEALFGLALAGGAAALIYIRRLQEPRHLASAPGRPGGTRAPNDEEGPCAEAEE